MYLLKERPSLITSDQFMMSIFQEFVDELPPFKDYLREVFHERRTCVVDRDSGAKVAHINMARQELFEPKSETNIDSTPRLIELARIAAERYIVELEDPKKATYFYLDISGSLLCWAKCPPEHHERTKGCYATNDLCESALGGTTANIQKYDMISHKAAASVSDSSRNGWFNRGVIPSPKRRKRADTESDAEPAKKKPRKGKGLFHQFPVALQTAIVSTGLKDAPAAHAQNAEELNSHHAAVLFKAELQKEEAYAKVGEEHMDAIYYHKMWSSRACLKTKEEVDRAMKELTSETARRECMKENINIRVRGLGHTIHKITWSYKRIFRTATELANHLKMMIDRELGDAPLPIPAEPPINAPKRASVGILGTLTKEGHSLDTKAASNENEQREKVERIRLEREKKGEGSLFHSMQPWIKPFIDKEFEGERIDVLLSVDINQADGTVLKELKWFQGEVQKVLVCEKKGSSARPKVKVLWDGSSDVEGAEAQSVSVQELMKSKWKKQVDGAWRMDVGADDVIELDEGEEEVGGGSGAVDGSSNSSDDSSSEESESRMRWSEESESDPAGSEDETESEE